MCKVSEAKLNCWVGRIALVISVPIIIFFGVRNLPKLKIDWKSILWCITWSLLGLGLSLAGSTPKKNEVGLIKRSGYYIFVVFIAAYVSYGFCISNESNWLNASLLAFIIGLSGNDLFGILKKAVEKFDLDIKKSQEK